MSQPGPYERNQGRVLGKLVRQIEQPRPQLVKPYRGGEVEAGYNSPLDGTDLETRTDARVVVYVSPMLGTIDQSCTDNAATNIVLGAVASYEAYNIVYHAQTGAYFESGRVLVFTDGTNAAAGLWQRMTLGSGKCLASLTADVNTGNLRLIVTTLSLGGACDFRATYTRVVA